MVEKTGSKGKLQVKNTCWKCHFWHIFSA